MFDLLRRFVMYCLMVKLKVNTFVVGYPPGENRSGIALFPLNPDENTTVKGAIAFHQKEQATDYLKAFKQANPGLKEMTNKMKVVKI